MICAQDVKVLEIIQRRGSPGGVKRIAKENGLRYWTVRLSVQRLARMGLVERTGEGIVAVELRATA